ncbi:hypothetical protein V8E54_002155 [Elaphomyces granulatus]
MAAEETPATNDATNMVGGPNETEEESKSNPNHAKQNEASADTGAQGSAEKNSETRPKAGGKRDNAATAVPADKTDATANPPSKKQKTNKGESVSAKDDVAATANGEKRRRGRPKKGVKNVVKKVVPPTAEGIGSRTRSRLKIS